MGMIADAVTLSPGVGKAFPNAGGDPNRLPIGWDGPPSWWSFFGLAVIFWLSCECLCQVLALLGGSTDHC